MDGASTWLDIICLLTWFKSCGYRQTWCLYKRMDVLSWCKSIHAYPPFRWNGPKFLIFFDYLFFQQTCFRQVMPPSCKLAYNASNYSCLIAHLIFAIFVPTDLASIYQLLIFIVCCLGHHFLPCLLVKSQFSDGNSLVHHIFGPKKIESSWSLYFGRSSLFHPFWRRVLPVPTNISLERTVTSDSLPKMASKSAARAGGQSSNFLGWWILVVSLVIEVPPVIILIFRLGPFLHGNQPTIFIGETPHEIWSFQTRCSPYGEFHSISNQPWSAWEIHDLIEKNMRKIVCRGWSTWSGSCSDMFWKAMVG